MTAVAAQIVWAMYLVLLPFYFVFRLVIFIIFLPIYIPMRIFSNKTLEDLETEKRERSEPGKVYFPPLGCLVTVFY